MSEIEPSWEVIPDIVPFGEIAIPESQDIEWLSHWLSLVNFTYGRKGYTTGVIAATFLRQRTNWVGNLEPGYYEKEAFRNENDQPVTHHLAGTFEAVEIRSAYVINEPQEKRDFIAFAEISMGADLNTGSPLGTPRAPRVIVPLNHIDRLILEHR